MTPGSVHGPRQYACAWLILSTSYCLQLTAQRYPLVYEPDSVPGQHLELIELQSEIDKRVPLMEQFAERYPDHPAIGWIYEQLMTVYMDSKQYKKVLGVGKKLLSVHPMDLNTARQCLAAAEALKDPGAIGIWRETTRGLAERILASPTRINGAGPEAWNRTLEAAQSIAANEEYERYRKILATTDQRARVRLIEEFLDRYPSTAYLYELLGLEFQAQWALGNYDSAAAAAGKILRGDPNNEDALLALASIHAQRRSAAALDFALRVLQIMRTKPRPQAVSTEFWARKKALFVGTAHWIAGNVHFDEQRFAEADTSFRLALPQLRGSATEGTILFYLGWANYKLKNLDEAIRFYKLTAEIHGPDREQALRNIQAIRSEMGQERQHQ